MTTVSGGLRDWLLGFSGFQNGCLSVDCLPNELGTFSLDSDPAVEETPFLCGGSAITRTFLLSSKEAWGEDVTGNGEILAWYETFAAWIREQNLFRKLPDLGDGRKTLSVRITSAPYPFLIDENQRARYQITLRVQYTQSI